MLHNVNLNTLTLCLSICNRMAPPTQHPLYPILEVEYNDQHRAHILSDTDARTPGRTSGTSVTRRYRAGFLELVRVVNYGLPPLDPALFTVAVDRCECLLCT